MWRGQYEKSYRILSEARTFIDQNDVLNHWGIIVQMHTFSALFSEKDSCVNLLNNYNNLVWNHVVVRERMHEKYLCLSNYSMLLAANAAYEDAYLLLQPAQAECPDTNVYDKFLLTTNLGALAYLLGNADEAILLETKCSKIIETQDVPVFSKPFLFKRNMVLLDVYQGGKDIVRVDIPLVARQTLATGYCSDHYTRLFLFSDINYWAN
jgi:hypothetical protein